jgi:hypothetical protein
MGSGRQFKDGREKGRITCAPKLDLATRYPRIDRRFPHAPFGSWFVSQIIPAAPNARTEVRRRPPNS